MYLPELSTTLSPGGSTLNVNYANRFTHLSLPRDFKPSDDPYPALRHRGSTEQAAKALLNVSQYYNSAPIVLPSVDNVEPTSNDASESEQMITATETIEEVKEEPEYPAKAPLEFKNKFHHNALLPPLPQLVSPGGVILQNTTETLSSKLELDHADIDSPQLAHPNASDSSSEWKSNMEDDRR